VQREIVRVRNGARPSGTGLRFQRLGIFLRRLRAIPAGIPKPLCPVTRPILVADRSSRACSRSGSVQLLAGAVARPGVALREAGFGSIHLLTEADLKGIAT